MFSISLTLKGILIIINVIKYCNKIKIPKILIETKKDVDKEIKKIFKNDILLFFRILRNILILKYVDKIHAHRKGMS